VGREHDPHDHGRYVKARTFRYGKKASPDKIPHQRVVLKQEQDEGFTGKINNFKATMGEERFARALRKNINVAQFSFRMALCAPRGFPGQKELDFLVYLKNGGVRAYSIKDLTFIHTGDKKAAQDKIDEARMKHFLNNQGVPVQEISFIDNLDLSSQADADKMVKELIG
jgi:hypothetical protein